MTAVNYKLRRPQPSRKPEHVPASLAMLADQFQAKEWPVGRGEFLVAGPPAPQPAPAPAFTIPPPPWVTDPRFGEAAVPEPELRPLAGALAELKAQHGDDVWPELDLRPAAVLEPLRRPEIPEPSWREELAAAEARDERDRLTNAAKLLGLEQAPKPTYPATKTTLGRTPAPEPAPEPSAPPRPRIPAPPWSKTEDGAA